MLKSLSQRLSRRKLQAKVNNDLVTVRRQQSTSEGLAHRSTGEVSPSASGAPKTVSFSAAGFHAHDPQTDSQVLQADSQHLFAAVLTSRPTARGGHYLKQHIHSELQAQVQRQKGDVLAAIQSTIATLNSAFKNLHPFNPQVLEGVQLSIAYVDFASQNLHIASTSGCRCIVGRAVEDGRTVEVVADVGAQEPVEEAKGAFPASGLASVALENSVDTIILGSTGFWHEVPSKKALLRLQHYFESAPTANHGCPAAHLTNFALHCITRRLSNSADLRMRSLQSVSNLLSLHTGDKSQFKWGNRQPVRRRRGDVHGDLTAVVVRMDWAGRSLKKSDSETSQQRTENRRRHSRWNLVRLHFLEYAAASRRQTRQQWHEVVEQLLEGNRAASKASKQGAVRPAVDLSARAGSTHGVLTVNVEK